MSICITNRRREGLWRIGLIQNASSYSSHVTYLMSLKSAGRSTRIAPPNNGAETKFGWAICATKLRFDGRVSREKIAEKGRARLYMFPGP